jgi:hypothetical protein
VKNKTIMHGREPMDWKSAKIHQKYEKRLLCTNRDERTLFILLCLHMTQLVIFCDENLHVICS